jgi:acyl transferase domain-containing protein
LLVDESSEEAAEAVIKKYFSDDNYVTVFEFCNNNSLLQKIRNLLHDKQQGNVRAFIESGWRTQQTLNMSLAGLYTKGASIDWQTYYQGKEYNRLILPSYPFRKKSYWMGEGFESSEGHTSSAESAFTDKNEKTNLIQQNSSPAPKKKASVEQKTTSAEQKSFASPESSHKEIIAHFLGSLLCRLLSIDEEAIDGNLNFSSYGIDSIVIQDAVRALEEYIGEPIEPSLFLDYPTINCLSAYLSSEFKDAILINDREAAEAAAEERETAAAEIETAAAEAETAAEGNERSEEMPGTQRRTAPKKATGQSDTRKKERLKILQNIANGKLSGAAGLKELIVLGGVEEDE